MDIKVEEFYDNFSKKFIEDIVEGNERVEQQQIFLSRAIPANLRTVLVIGCGSGQGAYFIATRIAKKAKVLAIDISSQNIKLAQSMYPHQRVEYRQADIIKDSIEGQWEAVILPDVYEHIPKELRPLLHQKLAKHLSLGGRLLFSVPSPGKQASLFAKGEGLQIVDEVVTLDDLNLVAREVGGVLTYFNMISAWETNDHIHAVVDRTTDTVRRIGKNDQLPNKGWTERSF